jgi:diguanylate cyclase (GGDEF)-like protein
LSETLRLHGETAAVFDIDPGKDVPSDMLLEQAKEIAAIRSLRDMQDVAAMKEKAEALVSRTQELEEAIRRDDLTGLFNRTYLEAIMATECELATKISYPLAVAFIDLDHFKAINDQYGHQAGDTVLIHCARLLLQNTRHSDITARYGGEEFVVVLPGTPRQGAQRVCERMLQSLRDTPCALADGGEIVATASIGLAIFEDSKTINNVHDLLHTADRALYEAKSRGRNQLVIAGTET